MTKAGLNEVIDELAATGIIINSSDYPKWTNGVMIDAILDHQGSDEEEEEYDEDEYDEDEEKEIVEPEVKKPIELKSSLPDWTELPQETDEQWLRVQYLKLLRREMDPSGQQSYLNHIRGGLKRFRVIDAIKASKEYRELHK